MRLPDFEAWAIFAAVVEHRSFSGAAAALGTSKATVSKAVARLERSLGATLFHRTSRRLSLTEGGRALAERARRIVHEAEAAEEAARQSASAPAGLIRIAAPVTFGVRLLAPLIAEFLAAHPAIEIDMRLSDARVDIVADGFDLAVRVALLPDSSLRARRLGPVGLRVLAAPAYLARHGRPSHPADLAQHRVIGYANASRTLTFTNAAGENVSVRPDGPLVTDNGEAMVPVLRAGVAIALLPDFILDAAAIADGSLAELLPEWSAGETAIHLLTPPSALRPARVEALLSFLEARIRPACEARNGTKHSRKDSTS